MLIGDDGCTSETDSSAQPREEENWKLYVWNSNTLRGNGFMGDIVSIGRNVEEARLNVLMSGIFKRFTETEIESMKKEIQEKPYKKTKAMYFYGSE